MGFLQDFVFANEGNEIPIRYLTWCAYGALSAVIGRRVFIDLEHFYVTPNIYAILIGKAGGRKTSGRDKVVDLLVEAAPDTIFSGDNDTYQGIISAMARPESQIFYTDHRGQRVFYRPYCIFAPEFPDYLQNNPLGMVAFLTNIYDRRHYMYRLKNQDATLEFPYVMMLACATPEWLAEQIQGKQFQAGYGRRTILVCNDGYEKKKPFKRQEHVEAERRCVARLKEIKKIIGPMVIEPAADEWFWHWYTHQGKAPDDAYLQVWRESWHINLLKLAMLTSLSERDDRVITTVYMQLALEHLKEIETQMPMVTDKVGRSELIGPSGTIINLLRMNDGLMSEKLVKLKTFKEFKDSTEQWKAIEFMKQTEQIIAIPKDGRLYYALPGRVEKTPKSKVEPEPPPQ